MTLKNKRICSTHQEKMIDANIGMKIIRLISAVYLRTELIEFCVQ